jgi:hypothetical protein
VPGDFNADGTVNAADYVAWRKGVGIASNQDNYNRWRTTFGMPMVGSGGSPSAPEPGGLLMLVLSAAMVLGCRHTGRAKSL